MDKVVISGDWLRRLVERVGVNEREESSLPEWVVEELRRPAETGKAEEEMLCIADVPPALKRRLQEEAVYRTFHRLEAPLRFLLYATVPGSRSVTIS
jgi:hypothetical protein